MQLSHFFTATKAWPSYDTIGIAVYRKIYLFRNQAGYVNSKAVYIQVIVKK